MPSPVLARPAPAPIPLASLPAEEETPSAAAPEQGFTAPPPTRVSRPAADFVFDAPRRASASTRPPTSERSGSIPTADSPVTATGSPDARTHRKAPPPPATSAAPPVDPIATTLAAAIRWTMSPDHPRHTSADPFVQTQVAAPRVPPALLEHPKTTIGGGEPPHDTRSPMTRVQQSAPTPAPRAEASPKRVIEPSQVAVPVSARPSAIREPATAERFSRVHIGSVEVQILPPPEQASMPPAVVRGPEVPAARLTRELTSPIGLRQS